jgi:aminoglycoside 6'-N-acetyltransferase I
MTGWRERRRQGIAMCKPGNSSNRPVPVSANHLFIVERLAAATPDWLALRAQLWAAAEPGDPAIPAILAHGAAFIIREDTAAIGFAEAALRHDYVNGCETSPVAFLEGVFIRPAYRRRGAARVLLAAVEAWARTQNVTEFASDALLANTPGHAMHTALGFTETERVIFYRKSLLPSA